MDHCGLCSLVSDNEKLCLSFVLSSQCLCNSVQSPKELGTSISRNLLGRHSPLSLYGLCFALSEPLRPQLLQLQTDRPGCGLLYQLHPALLQGESTVAMVMVAMPITSQKFIICICIIQCSYPLKHKYLYIVILVLVLDNWCRLCWSIAIITNLFAVKNSLKLLVILSTI